MQKKPVKSFKPKTTLKFDGEAEFKTETNQNFKPFRFVANLGDLDKRAVNNEKINRKQSIEKEHHHLIQTPHHNSINNQTNEQTIICCNSKACRPQSSLTSGAKFKDHLQNKADQISQQRRHINQIEKEQQHQQQQQQHQQQQQNIYHHHYHPNDINEELVDENNNLIEQRTNLNQYRNMNQKNVETEAAVCCDHCKHHYLNGINVPLGSATNQSQIELNPLVGVRAFQANKQINRIETNQQPIKRKIKIKEPQQQQQQHTNLVRSKSSNFQLGDKDAAIPRMNMPGKQRPHKNMSHLKFEGKHFLKS